MDQQLVASLTMYRLVAEDQAGDIRSIEASLTERFAVFDPGLRELAPLFNLRSQAGAIAGHDPRFEQCLVAASATGRPSIS